MNRLNLRFFSVPAMLALLAAAPAAAQQERSAPNPRVAPVKTATASPVPAASSDEFFIISSIDQPKSQIVLKRPTEVTQLVRVTPQSSFLDEQGKPLKFSDLRAGDTVFAALSPGADGVPVVLRIRRGPMTVDELHRRYIKFQ